MKCIEKPSRLGGKACVTPYAGGRLQGHGDFVQSVAGARHGQASLELAFGFGHPTGLEVRIASDTVEQRQFSQA